MIATCLVCQNQHSVVYNQTRGQQVMDIHQDDNETCRGSGYPPQDMTIHAQKSTILPSWVSSVIGSIAYDQGHASGMVEVAMIEEGLIKQFEDAMTLFLRDE